VEELVWLRLIRVNYRSDLVSETVRYKDLS
jgi:hypothetical protein